MPAQRIVIRWTASETASEEGTNHVTFEVHAIEEDTRTLVTITEASWRPTAAGAKAAFGYCEGWTGLLAALKVWLKHGIHLRKGFCI